MFILVVLFVALLAVLCLSCCASRDGCSFESHHQIKPTENYFPSGLSQQILGAHIKRAYISNICLILDHFSSLFLFECACVCRARCELATRVHTSSSGVSEAVVTGFIH